MTDNPSLDQLRQEIQATDRQIAALFEQRMHLVEGVIQRKMEKGLPIYDPEREHQLLLADLDNIQDPVLKEYYVRFQQYMMDLSKSYQRRLRADAAATWKPDPINSHKP